MLQALLADNKLALKNLAWTNGVAYLVAKRNRKKGFVTWTPGVNVIKLFLLQMMRPNKLECLYLAIPFQSSLTFAGNTMSLPKKETSER